jgi:uncharacterized membrane protein
MTDAARSYISQPLLIRARRQAWKVWAAGLVVVVQWLVLIAAAPLAKANGLVSISSPLYYFFSFLCHQISDRSFHVEGEQFAVCSRCFGVYFGLFVAFMSYPLWRSVDNIEPLPRVWLFLSLIPITVDWGLTFFGIWENTHVSRFLTGGLLGFACGTFIVPSIVEIARNLTRSRTFVD